MSKLDLVMFEEEFKQLQDIIGRLQKDASAKVVFLVDKNGQQIASAGEVQSIDATSLASLTAGNVAATDGLAKLIAMPLKQASQMNQCVGVLRIEIENLAVIVYSPELVAARVLYQA